MIGVPYEDLGSEEDNGTIVVLFGSAAGLVTSGALSCSQDNLPAGSSESSESGDLFGLSLAVSSANDLAVGVPFEDFIFANEGNAGLVNVLTSSPGDPFDGATEREQNDFLAECGTFEGNELGDLWGMTLAWGDFDGESATLAVAGAFESFSGVDGAGRITLMFGTTTRCLDQNSSGVFDAAEEGDEFGRALATGDFDGNGSDDLAIGAHGEDIGAVEAAGMVTVLYGLDPETGAFGTVQFSGGSGSIPEANNHAIVLVSRVGSAVIAASVDHARTGGTATPGVDFTYNGGSESWDAGDLSPNFFAVALEDDTLDEPNETIVFTLSDPSTGTAVGSPSTFTLTIVDNDVAGAISFVQPVTVFPELAGTVQVAVSRTFGAASGVTVQYATSNATAIAGLDYVATSGTLTFGANETTKFIPLQILDDDIAEGGEVFLVTLSNPGGGGVLGTFSVNQVVIFDNDIFHDGFESANTAAWSSTVP